MLLDLLAMCRDNSLGTGKPSVCMALDSACYGMIVFSEPGTVCRLSCGMPPVAGPLRGDALGMIMCNYFASGIFWCV